MLGCLNQYRGPDGVMHVLILGVRVSVKENTLRGNGRSDLEWFQKFVGFPKVLLTCLGVI